MGIVALGCGKLWKGGLGFGVWGILLTIEVERYRTALVVDVDVDVVAWVKKPGSVDIFDSTG